MAAKHCEGSRYPFSEDEIPVIETVRPDQLGVDLAALCAVREQVMDIRVLEKGGRLSAGQVKALRAGLEEEAGLEPDLNLTYLKACKYVLGRWPRPSEMKGLFGPNTKVFRQRFDMVALSDDDPKVSASTMRSNARVSHAIGPAGRDLNRVTTASEVCYVWFGPFGGRVIAMIYASAVSAQEARARIGKAQRLINQHSAKFEGDVDALRENGKLPTEQGFKVVASRKPGMDLAEVDMRKVFEHLQ